MRRRKDLERTNEVLLQLLADEKERTERLLALLMAKAAPAEFAAYDPIAEVPEPDGQWLFDDTGLNSTWIPKEI